MPRTWACPGAALQNQIDDIGATPVRGMHFAKCILGIGKVAQYLLTFKHGSNSHARLPGSLHHAFHADSPIFSATDQVAALIVRAMRKDPPLEMLGESVCPYCGVGCRLTFEGEAGKVLKVRGVETAAANLGGICAKGAQLGPTIHTPDRLSHPQLR